MEDTKGVEDKKGVKVGAETGLTLHVDKHFFNVTNNGIHLVDHHAIPISMFSIDVSLSIVYTFKGYMMH